MGPFAEPDGHDGPGLIDQLVPCVAAMVDDIVVGLEDPVRQPVVAHELPDVFDRIEFRAFRWQGQQGDVVGDGHDVTLMTYDGSEDPPFYALPPSVQDRKAHV